MTEEVDLTRFRVFVAGVLRTQLLRRRVWLCAYTLPMIGGGFLFSTPLPILANAGSPFAHGLLMISALLGWIGCYLRVPLIELPGNGMATVLALLYVLSALGYAFSGGGVHVSLIGLAAFILFAPVGMIGRFVEVWTYPPAPGG